MIQNNNNKNWKTTKEVSEALEVATKTILSFRSVNKQMFKGLVIISPEETIKGVRKTYLWSPESVKILVKKLPTVAKDWKNSIKNEFMEKGIVLANMHPDEQLLKIIGALYEQQERTIILRKNVEANTESIEKLEDKMDNTLKFIEQERNITQKTLKDIRDGYTWIANTYEIGWNIHKELKDIFKFSAYKDLTEYKAKQILTYIIKNYDYKTGNYQEIRDL